MSDPAHPVVEQAEKICPRCGRPDGSFACKVRHISLNTGDAKAAKDFA